MSKKQTKQWRNRIVGHGKEPPDQLVANPAIQSCLILLSYGFEIKKDFYRDYFEKRLDNSKIFISYI